MPSLRFGGIGDSVDVLADEVKVPFSEEMSTRICEAVMLSSRQSVDAAQGRNQQLQTWDFQSDGDPYWAGIPLRWEGGCDTEDPITDEQRYEIVAAMCYLLSSQEWLQVETTGTEDEDEQAAANIEAFLNDVIVESRINTQHLYDLLDMATRHSYGVLVCEWNQEIEHEYTPAWQHKKTGAIEAEGSEAAADRPHDYALVEEVAPRLLKDGIECRVPYTGDVYLDPPEAQSFKEAERILERFEYSAWDLIDGIEARGFDKDAVQQILASGPQAGSQTYDRDRDATDGLAIAPQTYEVFQVVGRPPALLEGGKPAIDKDRDRRRDYHWMICPEANVCFKFSPSRYARRPYVKFPFRGRAGRMIGHSLCSMLAPLQQEATIAFRFAVDFRDLYFSSPLLAPDLWATEFERWQMYPGAILPYPTTPPLGPNAITPLPVNAQGFSASMVSLQDCRARANQVFSSDARGPGSTLQRTATEASQAAAGADEKLDLLLMNFKFGVADLADVILSHYQQFAGVEAISKRIGSKAVEITPDMLKKSYRIMPVGTSENASPQLKLNRAKLLQEISATDPIIQQKAAQGDMTGVYEVWARLYRAAGIRNPEAILGKEPMSPMSPEMILQVLLAKAAQYAQAGDPAAQDLLSTVQQMMQPQLGGMPAQPGMAQPQPGAPQGGMPQGGPPMGMPPGGGGPMPMMPPQQMNPQMNGAGGPVPMGAFRGGRA